MAKVEQEAEAQPKRGQAKSTPSRGNTSGSQRWGEESDLHVLSSTIRSIEVEISLQAEKDREAGRTVWRLLHSSS